MMDAITIWQPWASLIAIEAKPYEFRGWALPHRYRQIPIAIHAGARPIRKAEVADLIVRLEGSDAWTVALHKNIALPFLHRVYSNPGSLPLSHVVCLATIGEPVRANAIVQKFGGPVNDSDRAESTNWAWPLRNVQRLEPPEPARGAQGFWKWGRAAMPGLALENACGNEALGPEVA
jgi:hypothetical protein